MKLSLTLALLLSINSMFSQSEISANMSEKYLKDTLISVKANPIAGFSHDYLLFVPRGTPKGKMNWLLVEPNNSGFTSDSIEKHREAAVFLATKRSIGNNISTELRMPLLVPVFPRPKEHALIYTHALDRDVMLVQTEDLKRLDLQLIGMIEDARSRLTRLQIPVEKKVLMNGFSASGSFVNRFLFLHPEIVQAASAGGLNGILMLPKQKLNGQQLNYPLGINDLKEISGKEWNLEAYKKVPQFIFMGELDDNDAVPFNDAYDDEERKVIYATVGKQMQPNRWEKCQQIYKEEEVNARFRTYEEVGHWSTGEINLEVIRFFMEQMSQKENE